jgi:hypothetical protein
VPGVILKKEHMATQAEIVEFLESEYPHTNCTVEAVGDRSATVKLQVEGILMGRCPSKHLAYHPENQGFVFKVPYDVCGQKNTYNICIGQT